MMRRRSTTYDVSWFLDQHRSQQLNLSPPYQRKSVWNRGDRVFFLDTIFRDYPCPPIFIHKTLDDKGISQFHIVDGKQRIETVIRFFGNKLALSDDFGDERLNGKKYRDIKSDVELRNKFLNYVFTVEQFDDLDVDLVNRVFERLNRNVRKLTNQEIRHARFSGWFATQVFSETERDVWKEFGISTTGRARRMLDAQFVAELFISVIRQEIVGFSQDMIDEYYSAFDIVDPDTNSSAEEILRIFSETKRKIIILDSHDSVVKTYSRTAANFYSLWMFVLLEYSNREMDYAAIASRYASFMEEVGRLGSQSPSDETLTTTVDKAIDASSASDQPDVGNPYKYFVNNQGATTELPQRLARHEALREALGQ
jgi:hypothetical protein